MTTRSKRLAQISLLLVGLGLIVMLSPLLQAQERVDGRQEYKVIIPGPYESAETLTALLNKEASEGWQLQTAVSQVFNNIGLETQLRERNTARIQTSIVFIFRRARK